VTFGSEYYATCNIVTIVWQVAMYQEKYDEFQQTLTKSNDVFQNFKNEMDKVLPCCVLNTELKVVRQESYLSSL